MLQLNLKGKTCVCDVAYNITKTSSSDVRLTQ